VRILLIGHGRMGRLVESLAAAEGAEIAGIVTSRSGPGAIESDYGPVDVAIDFSLGGAVFENLARLASRRTNVVIGTTGWQARQSELRAVAGQAGIGVLASANFAIGMQIFRLVAEEAARRFADMNDVGAWIHEAHHVAKKDAPSGTALMLQAAMTKAGYDRPIDVSSTRTGSIPGTHTVGFDGLSDTVTLTHTVRDRAVFARGALVAARWLIGRQGWFTLEDMLDGVRS
jgi:4-hydroxy-tetrahydrodipicolinate reductase